MTRKLLEASIPVALEFPDRMRSPIRNVLAGEYESGYFGQNLTILDIGANVGSFTVWANLRWPQSQIHAYEPQPETFGMLRRNVDCLTNVRCHNVAVYLTDEKQELLWSRYAGDGESGLVSCMERTFTDLSRDRLFQVSVLHPRDLPRCDVVKLDVEGAEAEILRGMDLGGISLVLLEYQNVENKTAIKELLRKDFSLEYEDSVEWDTLLPNSTYREELSGNQYGRLFFANRHCNRLSRVVCPASQIV